MKILLAILSCERDRYLEERQQNTFLRNCPVDYKFFRGKASHTSDDGVSLDVEDSFQHLPFKSQEAFRWALKQGYDYVFKCDTDTYVRPERLLTAEPNLADYIGYFSYAPGPDAYASGGSGYWLSRKAMEAVAEATMRIDPPATRPGDPSTVGEDMQVGHALRDRKIYCVKDDRYHLRWPGPGASNRLISLHDVALPDKSQRIPIAHTYWLSTGGH